MASRKSSQTARSGLNEASARRITNALNREPGLVSIKVQSGGGATVKVFGHPLLAGLVREYPAGPEMASASLLQALDLAVREGLALVIEYERGASK